MSDPGHVVESLASQFVLTDDQRAAIAHHSEWLMSNGIGQRETIELFYDILESLR